jgi:hypothetical protein
VAANYTNFTLNESVRGLQEIGFFNYVLPLSIFFLILYGILDQYHVISKDKKVNALVSLLMSSFVLLYAYVNNVEWFFSLFYMKMSIAILILLFAMTFAVFAFRALKENQMIPEGREKVWNSAVILMSVMIMSLAFESAPAPMGNWAADVSGVVMLMGVLGAVFSWFAGGKD